jgi:hypothetical protein
MQPPIIIGLAGRAGVGKDTVAEQLRDAGFIRFAFAEPLRQMLVAHLDLHGFNPYWINDRGFKETTLPVFGRSVRQHLQTMGAALRQDDPDYWVRCLALRAGLVDGRQPAGDRIVISDVRYRNEASWIRSRGGRIVRVLRHVDPVADHESERQVDHMAADLTIVNDGTLDDLRAQVAQVLSLLEARGA